MFFNKYARSRSFAAAPAMEKARSLYPTDLYYQSYHTNRMFNYEK